MIRVIIFTIIGITIFLAYTFVIFVVGARFHEKAVKEDGMAGLGGAKLLQEANQLLSGLVEPTTLDHASYLDVTAQERVNSWRATYDKWKWSKDKKK